MIYGVVEEGNVTVDDDLDGAAFVGLGLLSSVNPRLAIKVSALFCKDSLAMTETDQDTLVPAVEATSTRQVIITHGTGLCWKLLRHLN